MTSRRPLQHHAPRSRRRWPVSAPIVRVAAGILVALAASSEAAQRTFVASYGSDANACTARAPCRSFATALPHTDSGGEIVVLDSAGYGTVSIAQSVSIVAAQAAHAAISVASGSGITIDGDGVNVTLRGLTIEGVGGARGVRVVRAASVQLERCVITGMTIRGIDVEGAASVFIADSLVRDNGLDGVLVRDAADGSSLRVHRTRVERNGFKGIKVDASASVSVSDSTIADNGNEGVTVSAGAGENVVVDVVRALVWGNGATGIRVSAQGANAVATASVTDSVVDDNQGSGVLADVQDGGVADLAADRNAFVGNLWDGLATCNGGSTILASSNIALANSVGFMRCGGGAILSLGDNLVEGNTTDTKWVPPTIVLGK